MRLKAAECKIKELEELDNEFYFLFNNLKKSKK